MQGMAQGVCDTQKLNGKDCSVSKTYDYLQAINMIPELVRMQCSILGAWGKATPHGDLVQMRNLDFGSGPFGNRNMLIVHHPTNSHAFASLAFPGMVGIVTGFSEKIALSEKVWFATAPLSQPTGSYDGQADVFVIRDIVELSNNKEEAIDIMKNAKRTWPIWLGVGDYESQEMRVMSYRRKEVGVYDDHSLQEKMTQQKQFDGVVYVDKDSQPSKSETLPNLVERFYGNLTAENVAQYIPNESRSGDVHSLVFDFHHETVFISTGITNGPTGDYIRLSYQSPFLKFSMKDLWKYPKPDEELSIKAQ